MNLVGSDNACLLVCVEYHKTLINREMDCQSNLFVRRIFSLRQKDFRADNVIDYSADKVNGGTRTATAHFVAYGGGNALMLMDNPNRAANRVDGVQSVAPEKEFIEVTLPPNVNPGDVIHVKNPKGDINAIVVPAGMGPGSTFTVEFDAGDAPPPPEEEEIVVAVAEPSSIPSQYPDAPVYPTTSQPYGRY